MDYTTGALTWFTTDVDKIEDLSDMLDFLPETSMDVALLRRWGIAGKDGEKVSQPEFKWTQTALRPRAETVTIADDSTTDVTVADSGVYQVGELLRVEGEVMRITALADATSLTVTRGYSGTAAAHAAKTMYSLGMAPADNATPGSAVGRTPVELTNYVQAFETPVEASWLQMASKTVDGNTIDKQLEMVFTEINRQLARAVLYGIKKKDTTNKIFAMDGIFTQISSNVTNVGGALTIAAIDALILDIVNEGGNPTTLSLSPYQKQKLDALDTNKQFLGKKEHTGGNLITNTWQSGILNRELDVVVDKSLMNDQLLITDDEFVEIGPMEGNGLSGAWGTYNASAPGQWGKKQVVRGVYYNKLHNEKAAGYLYGLS